MRFSNTVVFWVKLFSSELEEDNLFPDQKSVGLDEFQSLMSIEHAFSASLKSSTPLINHSFDWRTINTLYLTMHDVYIYNNNTFNELSNII